MDRSRDIFQKACEVIPGGVNSPVRCFKYVGGNPIIVQKGKGDTIQDVDQRTYIDFCCSWGPLILGHAHPTILAAVMDQMTMGFSFGISTEIESKLARKIANHIPSIEKIRFVSSGTEATMTALRIARAATGRKKIVKFSGQYHGHHDSLLVRAGSGVMGINSSSTSGGVTEATIQDTICISFNDLDQLNALFDSSLAKDIAAVIVEPISGNMGVILPEEGFLETLRKRTAESGSLLIFDEVITGFRVGISGAQGLYKIDPDLTCLGKIIGGGFPVGAVGGKKRYMDLLAPLGEVYQAGTLSGNPIAMRAGYETLLILEKEGFYEDLELKTQAFLSPIREVIRGKGCIQSQGSMFTIFLGPEHLKNDRDLALIDTKLYASFFQYLLENGIYAPPASQESWFISSAHVMEHLQKSSDIICGFLDRL
jgi:glutamate-1-semialdehyde 2,1-aminomutase